MSFNQSLLDLRKAYSDLRTRLGRLCDVSENNVEDKKAWSPAFKDETSLAAVRLLRSLESAAGEALKLTDPVTQLYATRLVLEVDAFRVALEGDMLSRIPSTDRVGRTVSELHPALGLPKSGHATNFILVNLDKEQYCNAVTLLNNARGTFLGAVEDIQMLYEGRLLPIEERGRIRQALTEAGMLDAALRLEKADEQRVDHPQECVGNCRQALDLMVKDLAKIRGIRATDSFAGNLAELGKTQSFLSREERAVTVALYSHLSTNWKSGEEPKPADAEFALKLTYYFIDRLLGTTSAA